MRVIRLATAGLGLTCLLAGGVPASASPAPPGPSAGQALVWGPCPARQEELRAAGARCAKVTVPLDHARPGGPTIEIAVSRIAAKAGPGKRRGILLSNPGGPGGTGLANTLYLRPALKDAADRYDLIGFDPRFLGESTPVICDPATPVPAPGPTTTRRAEFDRSVDDARDTARRCEGHDDNARLLPHATSRNVARDMDAIRAALGERGLSYYGVSYGADLGAVYAQMFPHRADRIVLDSSTDPTATQYQLFQRAGRPLEEALDDWAGWAALHDGTYRLGSTPARVRAGVEELLDGAERRPVEVSGVRLTAPVLRLVLRQFIQHEEYDPALASTVHDLVEAAAGRPVEPGPELAAMLELLTSPELADSMLGGAVFMCGDSGWPAGGWPKDPEAYWRNMESSRVSQPVFGPLVNAMTAPCAFWKSTSREPATVIGNQVPLLMLQARRDNNVPYEGALALHRRLTGSRLVTADMRAHGVFGRGLDGLTPVPCADRAVVGYLRDGTLPAADVTCGRTEVVR
ncbi:MULTISPECIES: alpha/beta hydrolase [unclassified Streptomyces]|uniref:alpha/beta hydrolase n=1 Tax=unclassified Streptomyces TaxID=2593676 RepID=UPI00036FD570|nr:MULTISPECIES: alpha/beta hydrolase [unclassified Streptomyces]MYY02921.1 alpha/beta fold hydrolase [Streptomyces sp. SID4913]